MSLKLIIFSWQDTILTQSVRITSVRGARCKIDLYIIIIIYYSTRDQENAMGSQPIWAGSGVRCVQVLGRVLGRFWAGKLRQPGKRFYVWQTQADRWRCVFLIFCRFRKLQSCSLLACSSLRFQRFTAMGDGVSTNITICTLQHEGGKLSAVKHTDIRNH